MVAAYNRQMKESRTFEIALNAIPVAKDARLVEIERGRVSEAARPLSATIAPGSVNFYLLASPADYTVPEGEPASPLKPIQQSLQLGMDFLRLQPTAAAGLDLPKKDPAKLYVAILKNRRSPLGGCDLGAGSIVATLGKQGDIVADQAGSRAAGDGRRCE